MSAICNTNNFGVNSNSKILLVSSSQSVSLHINKIIEELNLVSLLASDSVTALDILDREHISYILIDANIEGLSSDKLVELMRESLEDRCIPIIILASMFDEVQLSLCKEAGCDDFLFEPFTAISLKTRMASLKQISDLKYLYKDSLNEQLVANRILSNALEERSVQLEEIGLLSISASVFSGDLFLTARHKDGSLNVLLADFTGHGLSAAIGALPVADIFSAMTTKGFELDSILESINKKLYTLLPTSMFMACSVLNISIDLKRVKVWNGGMPDIYIRSYGMGHVKNKIKSSHIPLGIDEKISNRFKLESLNLTPGDEFILYTDGLTDAMNSDKTMYGYENLNNCIQALDNDLSVFSNLVESFNQFCGDVPPVDDVTLACIPCTSRLMEIKSTGVS